MVSGMAKTEARGSAVRCSVYKYLLAEYNAGKKENKVKLQKHLRVCKECRGIPQGKAGR